MVWDVSLKTIFAFATTVLEAQAARADDQAMLIGLWEQLDATHAKAFTTTCQWILANNHVALVEAARDRVEAKATQ